MVYANFSSNLPTGLQHFEFVDLTIAVILLSIVCRNSIFKLLLEPDETVTKTEPGACLLWWFDVKIYIIFLRSSKMVFWLAGVYAACQSESGFEHHGWTGDVWGLIYIEEMHFEEMSFYLKTGLRCTRPLKSNAVKLSATCSRWDVFALSVNIYGLPVGAPNFT